MGIMDTLFGSGNKTAAAPAPAASTGAPAAATGDQGAAPAGQQNQSPLDSFNEAFKIDTSNAPPADTRLFGEVDPKKVMESAGTVNFLQVANPTDIEAVKAGGDEATKALGRILQAVTSASYGQSAIASTQMIEQAATLLEQRLMNKLPGQVRNTLVDTTLASSNAAFNHPAVAPLVELAKSKFIQANPTASAEEISSMTTEYMKAVAGAFSDKPDPVTAPGAQKDTDWFAELGLTAQ